MTIPKGALTIAVEVWTENLSTGKKYKVTEGTFVFFAIDEHSSPRPVLSSI